MDRFFPDSILKAILIDRPNRFVVNLSIDGVLSGASLPNPGKLGELFIPGSTLYIQKMRSEVKYPYRVIGVESAAGEVIMLDTHTNNRIAEYLIANRHIPSLIEYRVKKREVAVGHSRFDLLLENNQKELLYCEVKSCTLFGGQLAMFPDAVTARGKRHVEELAQMSDSGVKTALVFVIQSVYIQYFVPDYHTDPEFSETLYQSRDKIKIIPVTAGWNEKMELQQEYREVPILWDLYESEANGDRGSYLMLFFLEEEETIDMGVFGKQKFKPGYYVYVSFEEQNLKKLIERHKRKRKNCLNQRDYLRNKAKLEMVWPIRSSKNNCCIINSAIGVQSDFTVDNFDSLFCACPTHLHYFKENPRLNRDFQEMILDYRMRYPLKNR